LTGPQNDDLFAPTLETARRPGERRKPWRLSSQFWVAFFGGPLAIGTIAWFNSHRLELERDARRWIALTAVAGLALGVGLALAAGIAVPDLGSGGRLASQAAGVLTYGVLHRIQKPADRVYSFYDREGDGYASLKEPGIAAALGFGLPTAIALGLVARAV
jgi:hypothetical protein